MKKIMSIMLGLTLVLGSVSFVYAQDDTKKEEGKKKKGKKKEGDEKKEEAKRK